MKKLVLFLAVVVGFISLFSCQKNEAYDQYETYFGIYTSSEFQLNTDSQTSVLVDRLSISEVGVSLSYSDDNVIMPACNFSPYVSDRPEFDYKLTFDGTTLFVLNIETGMFNEQPSPSSEELNNGRSFYLKKPGESEMLFVILYDNGATDTYIFRR